MCKIYLILICFVWGVTSLPFDEFDDQDDIVAISQPTLNEFTASDTNIELQRFKRNGKRDKKYRWKNATVPIRYDMMNLTDEHVAQIDKAMKMLENVTCIRFVNRTDERDFVTITGDADLCSSMVGRRRGEQIIKLGQNNKPIGRGCFKITSIMHEIIHTLGFYHLHIGPDRDKHIKIVWENVDPERKHKLNIQAGYDELTDFDVGFDVDSIMLYKERAFSVNGHRTIKTIDKKLRNRIGQRERISDGDILRINRMYKCKTNGKN